MPEQRRQKRLDDPLIDVDGVWTAVYNISLGGMCIGTLEPLKIGWRRKFRLIDRETRRSWTLLGTVVWINPVDNELTRVGVQWHDLDSETQAWLEGQMQETD